MFNGPSIFLIWEMEALQICKLREVAGLGLKAMASQKEKSRMENHFARLTSLCITAGRYSLVVSMTLKSGLDPARK
jgi:hypothetical protein